MLVFFAIFLVALAATAVGTPQIRRIAMRTGFVDEPAGHKQHEQPTPLLGGLAIVAGMLLALALASYLIYGWLPRAVTGVLLACALVAVIGLIDDRLALPAWVKLLGQLAATILLITFGIYVQLPLPEPLNYLITFLWLAGISNAINFLDNMDGLSVGVSAVAAAFILLLAAVQEQFLVAAMAAALLGGCLGFLRYNFFPAEIYMGDAGLSFSGVHARHLGHAAALPSKQQLCHLDGACIDSRAAHIRYGPCRLLPSAQRRQPQYPRPRSQQSPLGQSWILAAGSGSDSLPDCRHIRSDGRLCRPGDTLRRICYRPIHSAACPNHYLAS